MNTTLENEICVVCNKDKAVIFCSCCGRGCCIKCFNKDENEVWKKLEEVHKEGVKNE